MNIFVILFNEYEIGLVVPQFGINVTKEN